MFEFLTPDQLAGIIGTSPETMRRWLRTGFVKGYRVGGRWRIAAEEVTRVIDEFEISRQEPAPFGWHKARR